MASDQRRRYPRSPARGTVALRVVGGEGGMYQARLRNISASGALLEAEQLPVGTRVKLRISRGEGQYLDIEATIVRSDEPAPGEPPTIAVSFQRISRTAVSIAGDP